MDDNVGPHAVKHVDDFGQVGNVGLEVLHSVRLGPAVALAFEIDDGDGGGFPIAEEHADDVVT